MKIDWVLIADELPTEGQKVYITDGTNVLTVEYMPPYSWSHGGREFWSGHQWLAIEDLVAIDSEVADYNDLRGNEVVTVMEPIAWSPMQRVEI